MCNDERIPEHEEKRTECIPGYDELYTLCYRLESKVNRVSKTVKWIAALTVVIALISIALSIGNAVAGCGCKHAENCSCASRCLSGWGVAALVLGIISAMLSAMVAFIGIANDVSKEQVFVTEKNVVPANNNVNHNKNMKKEKIDFMKFYYVLIYFFTFFAMIFSMTLLILNFQ